MKRWLIKLSLRGQVLYIIVSYISNNLTRSDKQLIVVVETWKQTHPSCVCDANSDVSDCKQHVILEIMRGDQL